MDIQTLLAPALLGLVIALFALQLIPLGLTPLARSSFHRPVTAPLLFAIAGVSLALGIAEGDERLVLRAPFVPEASSFLALYLDRLSCLMFAFVSLVGGLVYRYSVRYLDGEARHDTFLVKLVAATASAQLLAISGTLLVFAISWVLIGLCLHALLEHYHSRPRAILAARKKFIISRIGDVLLAFAAVLIWAQFGTIDFAALFEIAKVAPTGQSTIYLELATVSILGAAMCKSAQLPFHSWLPDTLETPTPVSALMHAGIINGGGYAIIRLSPLFNLTPNTLTLAVIIGALTAIFGLVVMWSQTNIKKRLAWSTVGQMGFMFLECGLGAYTLALVHIIGHGLYKAHAFLNSGTLKEFAQPLYEHDSFSTAFISYVLGVVATLFVLSSVGSALGHPLPSWPGGVVAPLLLVLALSQLFVYPGTRTVVGYSASIVMTAGIAALAIGLDAGMTQWLAGALPQGPTLETRGSFGFFTLIATAIGFVLTSLLSVLITSKQHRQKLEPLFTHGINGFYLGLYADHLTRLLWPQRKAASLSSHSLTWEKMYE